MSETKDKTFEELFSDGWTDPTLPSDYSPVDDCLIGTIELINGVNTIQYSRTGSFSLNSSDLILVVEHTDHEHEFSSAYEYDQNYHWQPCSAADCPFGSTPMFKEAHNFIEVETGAQNSSCNDRVEHAYVCSVCGYQKTVRDSLEHTYDETKTYYGVNSEGRNYTTNYCSVCQKNVIAMQFTDSDIYNGSYNSGKLTAGTVVQWRIPVFQTGKISIYLPCKMSSGNTNQTYDPSLYEMSVNYVGVPILMPTGTYNELGINASETKYYKWAEYTVTENDLSSGEIVIQFTSNVSSYRMIFTGEIRIEY